MRSLLALLLALLAPSAATAQTEETVKAIERKLETLKFIQSLEAPGGGFYVTVPDRKGDAKPVASLRATNGAARAWKYLGGDNPGATLPNKDRHAAFVLSCYDPKTGGFAEPGGKPDVTITSIGVMAAAELGIAHQKYARAMDYLKENAKTFEEVRIGAAAVEAWGVKECPFKLGEWFRIGKAFGTQPVRDAKDDARDCGSLTAMWLRLGNTLEEMQREVIVSEVLKPGQREDGGWGKKGEKASDIETTYRVMRALMLLKEKPKEAQKLRAYIEAHRNKDGGYATKPGDPSSMSGVYYCAIVTKWLNEPEGAKR